MDGTAKEYIDGVMNKYRHGLVNTAWYMCGQHVDDQGDRVALRYHNQAGETAQYTFKELDRLSGSLAQSLKEMGIQAGDSVGVLLPKIPELVIAGLAIWRLGAVYLPLFTAFGTEALQYRLEDSRAKLVITNRENQAKLSAASSSGRVLLVDREPGSSASGDHSFWELLRQPSIVSYQPRIPEDTMILIYTSGTTGNPKAVPVPLKALAAFETYMRIGLDLQAEDNFWNLADPGWAYGLYYGLIGPLLLGQSTFYYHGAFDPASIYRLWDEYKITNFAAAPTAYRAMRAEGHLPALSRGVRVLSSAGEPLNPGVILWAEQTFGVTIHDHYGQTELGMVINNHQAPEWSSPVRHGSMGVSMPGFHAVLLNDQNEELGPSQEGHVAIDTTHSPLFWFKEYYQAPDRTRERLSADGRYYLTGDDASTDPDGNFYFSGRSDDIILSAGYRIGPFEVESTLMTHPKVAEAAVVGVPDELRGESVKAFIVCTRGTEPDGALEQELKDWVRARLAKTAYPREVVFVPSLPKTPSGKIQRFLLRQS